MTHFAEQAMLQFLDYGNYVEKESTITKFQKESPIIACWFKCQWKVDLCSVSIHSEKVKLRLNETTGKCRCNDEPHTEADYIPFCKPSEGFLVTIPSFLQHTDKFVASAVSEYTSLTQMQGGKGWNLDCKLFFPLKIKTCGWGHRPMPWLTTLHQFLFHHSKAGTKTRILFLLFLRELPFRVRILH